MSDRIESGAPNLSDALVSALQAGNVAEALLIIEAIEACQAIVKASRTKSGATAYSSVRWTETYNTRS